MARKKSEKECVDMRVCIDADTYDAIIRYQGKVVSEKGADYTYKRWEAASDLFCELVKKSRGK